MQKLSIIFWAKIVEEINQNAIQEKEREGPVISIFTGMTIRI